MSYQAGGVGPSGPRATFGTRFLASLLDGGALLIVNLLLIALIGSATARALSIVVGVAYFGYFEGSPSGQTVGKRALGIRVIDFGGGGPIGFGRALIRYIGRLPSALVFGIGYLWMLWDPERQTWHDKLANTVVVPTADYPVEAWPG